MKNKKVNTDKIPLVGMDVDAQEVIDLQISESLEQEMEANYSNLIEGEIDNMLVSSSLANIYMKKEYNIADMHTWKNIPGWINDAEQLYQRIIKSCKDGDHVIEIGTYFGQSACYMGELIRDSGKKIKFDTIDSFEALDASFRAGYQPVPFEKYRFLEVLTLAPMSEIVKMHIDFLDLNDIINVIICESNYAHFLYDDNSLKMVYLDGSHIYDQVFNDMKNYWPKVKPGGFLCGDDIVYKDVKKSFNEFISEFDISSDNVKTGRYYWSIKKDNGKIGA